MQTHGYNEVSYITRDGTPYSLCIRMEAEFLKRLMTRDGANILSDMKKEFDVLRRRANRGYSHVFLKSALAESCDVTTVEAGNVFSPGAWTCGISLVWRDENGWKSVEELPLEALQWRFEDGMCGGIAPVLRSDWTDRDVQFTHRLTHLGGEGASGVDYAKIAVENYAGEIGVLVRDIGPAGGKISSLKWDESRHVLTIGDGPHLCLESAPHSIHIWRADELFDAPAALILWTSSTRFAPFEIKFRVEHGFGNRALGSLAALPPHGPQDVEAGFERAIAAWKAELPARVNRVSHDFLKRDAPVQDARVARVWEMCAYHLLAAAEAGTARIGALNYPHLWLRDGVLVARAFDLMGRYDLARRACDEIAPQIFAGGFGAESDAPGQGIWALVSHARQTNDFAWLEAQWPHIETRLNWIVRMMTTQAPLRAVGAGRIPAYLETPAINVVCQPAKKGCISGRMDWHAPDFFINCWSVRGLRDGAFAAQMIGGESVARGWNELADELETAVFRHLLPAFGNERDSIITPYPSGTLTSAEFLPALREKFAAWFRAHRLDGKIRRRETLWTYFEVAQIHNAFRLGLHDEAWTCLDALLDDELETGTFLEGTVGGNEFLPFGNGAERRGWLNPESGRGGNMPHGWTCAEMINLLHFIGAQPT